jgi:hypothetical protein
VFVTQCACEYALVIEFGEIFSKEPNGRPATQSGSRAVQSYLACCADMNIVTLAEYSARPLGAEPSLLNASKRVPSPFFSQALFCREDGSAFSLEWPQRHFRA